MEGLILLPVIVALYWVYRINSNTDKSSSGITKVDDKHWIVNNELVSFDNNDELSVMRQEREDDHKFNEYVRYRFKNDAKRISDQWLNVKMYPEYEIEINKVTNNELDEQKDDYQEYLKQCEILGFDTPLTEKEFAIRYKGALLFSALYIDCMIQTQAYTLYSPDNAKYRNGYTVEQEFKEKYY